MRKPFAKERRFANSQGARCRRRNAVFTFAIELSQPVRLQAATIEAAMNLQLGTIDRRGSAWWYVRPELLASLIALLVICLIVWAVTKTHLTGVKQLVQTSTSD